MERTQVWTSQTEFVRPFGSLVRQVFTLFESGLLFINKQKLTIKKSFVFHYFDNDVRDPVDSEKSALSLVFACLCVSKSLLRRCIIAKATHPCIVKGFNMTLTTSLATVPLKDENLPFSRTSISLFNTNSARKRDFYQSDFSADKLR